MMVYMAFFLAGVMMVLMAVGLLLTAVMPGVDRWSRRFFFVLFSCFLLSILSYFGGIVFYLMPDPGQGVKIAGYFESLFISIPIPMMMVFLLHCTGENWKRSPLFYIVFALWSAYFLLLSIGQFTTFLYYVSAEKLFENGPWYPLLMAPLDGVVILNLIVAIQRRDQLPRRYHNAFLVFLIPMTVALMIHTLFFNFLIGYMGVAIFALAMFGIVLSDQVEQYLRQQREIAHQRASIMVLQMRPHFIHNTMTSIYYLCAQDPRKAQQVTMDFNTYLRKNFTAIASEETIPFTEELEHTRAYLAVEQAQFDDRLFVDYDTPHTGFSLPPLTLQPIVENAVKHGMDPDGDALRISIRTRETESGSEVLVEDNGSGYEPSDDQEPHIALENIRQRLKIMCGGRLTIRPRPGGGTSVEVTIPRS